MREAQGAPLEACASRPSSPPPHDHLPKGCFSCLSSCAAFVSRRQAISRWHQGSAPLHCVVVLLVLALIEQQASSVAFAFQANTPHTISVSSLLRPTLGASTEAVLQPQAAPSSLFRASWDSSQAHAWELPAATFTRPLDDVGPAPFNLHTGGLEAPPSEASGAAAGGRTESSNTGWVYTAGPAQVVIVVIQKTSGHEHALYSPLVEINKSRQHPSPLAGGPSRVEVNSFFRFLEALAGSKPQQRCVPLSATVDAVLFLAGCAVSSHWTLRISRAAKPSLDPQAAGGPTPQQQQQRQQEGNWLLLCTPSGIAAPAEVVPLQAVSSLFTSLHQLLPQLPCSFVTRLLPPLFLLGRSLGAASAGPLLEASKEVREAAAALLHLLQAVLQRAAAEAPLLPAGETVQRVSAVADALAGWSRRRPVGPSPRSFIPLLSLGMAEIRGSDDREWAHPWQGRPAGEASAEMGTAALEAALQREGAPALPQTLLHAAAEIMEASARAAAQGMGEAEPLQQHDPQQQDTQSFSFPRKLQLQQQQQQHGSEAGMMRTLAGTVREVVAAVAAWLPVFYLIMRVNGGIWLPALQQLAEAAAHQITNLLELFLSHQQQQQQQQQKPEQQKRGCRGLEVAAEDAHCNALNAVGRLLYSEVQQLAACLARMHALKPLRGMRRLASAAVAFDRHLSSQLSAAAASSRPTEAPLAAAAAAANGSNTALPVRPLLHIRDPPKDLREAERRARFFCSLVALGVGDSSITAGVAACLPSDRQFLSLSPLSREGKQQNQRQKARFRSHNAEAAATQCARHLPLQLLQRLLVCCSWIGDSALVLRGLAALKLRLETLTLQHLMRAHSASPLDCSRTSSRLASASQIAAPRAATAAAAAGSESNVAELVGKTLALLAKVASRLSHESAEGGKVQVSPPLRPADSSLSLEALQLPDKDLKRRASGLWKALCDLASAATLWAAATGFERQSPEDVALLTFSLIPFWLQHDHAAGASSFTHTAQHVEHIRAAAAAAATAAQEELQQQLGHDEWQKAELTEQQLVDLARSLRGVSSFFAGGGVAAAARAVNPAAVEFFLSELTERRGAELARWPPALLFLLAYNVLRLRLTRSPEAGRGLPRSGPADGDGFPAAAPAAAAAAGARQQQLGKAVEAAAAQLLLRVVTAIEKGISFPESVDAWCRQVSLQSGKQQQHIKQQPPALNEGRASLSLGHKLTETLLLASTELSAEKGPVSTTTTSTVAAAAGDDGRRCNIRLVGLREVGSFLWALSRAEGGYSAALAAGGGSAEAATGVCPGKGVKAAAGAGASSSRSLSPSCLSTDLNGDASLTLQEASRIAAQAVRRSGGLADKLAVYCGAAIREANGRLLECSSPPAFRRPLSGSRPAFGGGAAAGEDLSAVLSEARLSPLEALKGFCRKYPTRSRAFVMLRSSDLPSLSWTATAGVSLGLLLNFFSSCRPDIFNHLLSAVLQAPLLAADCGLPQLFHLLRPLAASVRSELEASEKMQGKAYSMLSHAEGLPASSQKHIAHHQQSHPAGWQQQATRVSSSSRGRGSSNSGCLRLLEEAQAFIFAVAVGLLQHAQAVSTLPPDTPRTAAQVQLLFLASSDLALLLHAHCLPADRMQGAPSSPLKAEGRPQSTCVTASAGFRRVLQELLAQLSGLAVRYAKQICGSLPLLAAAAEIFSRCGRCMPLPTGSRQAMQAFAPAAIAALRQPASSHPWRSNSPGASSSHAQKAGGAEEIRRLAEALEALKFVELK
ncbi:hypothetical protein Esti_000781 [Eimeria stiedai]